MTDEMFLAKNIVQLCRHNSTSLNWLTHLRPCCMATNVLSQHECVGRIGAITGKAHGVGPLIQDWPFSYRLMRLEEKSHCSTKTYYPPQSWTHASFPPTWMKKAYLWGLSPVNSSSLYLNILSSVFLLCLGSDTVNMLLVCWCVP